MRVTKLVSVTLLSSTASEHQLRTDPKPETQYKQECIPVGCVPPAAVAVPGAGGGCLPVGCLPRQGVSARGVSARHHPVDRIAGTCKNITLPQLRCGR